MNTHTYKRAIATRVRASGAPLRMAGASALMASLVFVAGCESLDVTNTNAPTVETLTGSPTRSVLARAATGIFAQTYNDIGTEIQYYALYGREGYNLQGNDPRETGEQIRGPQDPTGRNSAIWTNLFSAIRSLNTYLAALPVATGMTPAEVKAAQGFAKTIKAWHITRLAVRTGALGIPLDVDQPITAAPAPFVSFGAAMEAASALMDEGAADLAGGGSGFPFAFPPGYTGFSTPSDFLKFNRALAAKILVYRATFLSCTTCWAEAATALNGSFVTAGGLPGSLSTGVNYAYSAAAGEPSNPVTEPLSNNRLWVHPSIVTGAQNKANGQPDNRLTNKVLDAGRTRNLNELTGTHKPILYNSVSNPELPDLAAPIPWINNEELLLLRAETRWNTSNKQGAIDDLNLVRVNAGGLAATTLTSASPNDAFVTELLYNRLYSLMWSQGTRWLDARRYNRLEQLPVDRAGDSRFPNMIVPAAECTARGLGSPCTPLN